MGTWGVGPFDSDSAGDMVAGLMDRVRGVFDEKGDYGYNEARAAAQFVLMAHGTDILGGPRIDIVVRTLAKMRSDADWIASYREPKKIAAALDKELREAITRMHVCKGCRKNYNKAEWGELEGLVADAIGLPVPKSKFPPSRFRHFKRRRRFATRGANRPTATIGKKTIKPKRQTKRTKK